MANEEYQADEVTQLSRNLQTAEQLPAGLMLLKMENSSMMAVARAQPRDNALIVRQLEALIDAYPAAADEAVYRKPVGSVTEGTCTKCGIRYELPYGTDPECPGCQCTTVKDKEKTMKFAEGLSIRAAESIRAIYGCNRLAVSTEAMGDDGRVKISATFVDYAACNMTTDDAIVSPWYKSRAGGMQRTPEDRFLNVVVKAAKSKLVRDVILDAVPNIIKAAFREACERKMAGLLAPEEVEQKIIPHFKGLGLSVAHLEKLLNRPKALGWTNEDKIRLKQIATAIKNGETTVAAILRDLADEPAGGNGKSASPSATGSVSGADLTKDAKDKPKPTDTKQAPKETKEPAGETKGTQSEAEPQGEPTEEEKAAIARAEFADACKEKFAAEHSTISMCKSQKALDNCMSSIDKDDTWTEAERMVARKWVAARRAELKGGK